MNLYENLQCYCTSGIYPMHMPGHKRNGEFQMVNPYSMDVTEVEGTDNLHDPEGMIRGLMDHMRKIYQTRESWPLVNGSTCGILAAISACVHRGDRIIMDRNCHRSVYHAVYLLDLKPIYLYPDTDRETGIALGIRKPQVDEALRDNPEAACVVVTSPTYEGVVSDIRGIADRTHRMGVPFIVDGAHGAHFSWGHPVWEQIPEASTAQGADLVVESLHKTLPSLTQTAVLHLCSDRVDPAFIQRYLAIYESSSPSYVLMAGVAQCMDWMEFHKERAFLSYRRNWQMFHRQTETWKCLSLWEGLGKDPTKLVILSGSLTGQALSVRLREKYHIQVEMEAVDYVLALTTICDTDEGWQRLAAALTEIDQELQAAGEDQSVNVQSERLGKTVQPVPGRMTGEIRKSLYVALNSPWERVRIEDSTRRTAAEYAFVYPPGIPFLVPGEAIDEEALEKIRLARINNLRVMGLEDQTGEYIRVCTDG